MKFDIERAQEKKLSYSDVEVYLNAELLEKEIHHGLCEDSGHELKWNGKYPSGGFVEMPCAEETSWIKHFSDESAAAAEIVHALTCFALVFCSERVDPLAWALRIFETCAEFYPMDYLQEFVE